MRETWGVAVHSVRSTLSCTKKSIAPRERAAGTSGRHT